MATFTIVLDKRVPVKGNKYNLVIRVCDHDAVLNLIIAKLSEKDYNTVFKKKSQDQASIDFRETCNAYISKCERISSEMKVYDPKRFRELFFKKDEDVIPDSLLVKNLVQRYVESKDLKLRTKIHYRMTGSVLEKFSPNLSIMSVNPDFLNRFARKKIQDGCSQATIDSLYRDLRSIIKYFTNEVNIIPTEYEYPFGRGKYTVGSYFPKKQVLSSDEIQKVLDYHYSESFDRRYALLSWKILYHANGINYADLLRLREDQIGPRSICFTRKKTETTRINNKSQIEVPLTEPLIELIRMIRETKPMIRAARKKNGKNPFFLGLLEDGYTEQTYENLLHKIKQKINLELTIVSKELNLSVPLKLKTARDCYASSLLRGGVPKDVISSLLGHANSIVTERYLASMDLDAAFKANAVLLK
jgi:integrase